MGTGELRMIHSRVSWMFRPVERSMTVSAPQRMAQRIFSTSSSIEEATALLPRLALIFTRKLRPMIIGSSSGWLMLAGMMARPRATSLRTNSGVISRGMAAPKLWPGCWCRSESRGASGEVSSVAGGRLQPHVLADRDELHLGRDDAAAGVGQLGDGAARGRAAAAAAANLGSDLRFRSPVCRAASCAWAAER